MHYLTSKFNLLPGSDISEITIVFNNLSFVFLYLAVLGLYRKGIIQNKLTGLFSPILATISAVVLLVGGLLTNFKNVSLFLIFCLFFCLIAFAYYQKNQKRKEKQKASFGKLKK